MARAEDRPRDRATRLAGLLAEGGGGLEPGEGQEAEDGALEHVAEAGAARRLEHVEGEALVARRVAADELDEDDRRDHDDQRDGQALGRQQHPGGVAGRPGAEQERAREGDEADDEARAVPGVVPDADPVEEVRTEDAGGHAGDAGVEGVGAHQGPAGEHAGARPQGHADEGEDGSGVVVVLAQPADAVRDEQHADGREDERQRDGPADQRHGALGVDVGRHRGRHQGDGEPDRPPDGEAPAAQPTTPLRAGRGLGRGSRHRSLLLRVVCGRQRRRRE